MKTPKGLLKFCWLNTKLAIGLLLALMLGTAGCERNLSTSPITPVETGAALSHTFTPAPKNSIPPTPSAPASPPPSRVVQPTLSPIITMNPTLVPTIGPGWEPEVLRQSYQINTVAVADGYRLTRLSSAVLGLRSADYCQTGPYQWMDDTHLLIFPLVGQEEGMGITDWSYPLVADLDQQRVWAPDINSRRPIRNCNEEPAWSDATNRLYSPTDGKILVYLPDGSPDQTIHESGPVLISPSGKHLLTATSWIDLESGRSAVHSLQLSTVFALAWSSDETRVFGCCYQYFDSATGKTSQFELGSLLPAGRGVSPGFSGVQSSWVVSDTYATIEWDMQSSDSRGQVPLIVADTQAYIDLRDVSGMDPNTPCQLTSISPDRLKVWLGCDGGSGRLVDLTTFTFRFFSSDSILVSWSMDSQAGMVNTANNWRVFASLDGEWITPLIPAGRAAAWSPEGHQLAAISNDGTQLTIWNLETQTPGLLSLPGIFTDLAWAPDSSRLALQNSDGSVWLLPDLNHAAFEQLTPSLPQVGILQWSPSGEALAFTSTSEVYVVRLTP
jgi:hypothetical protein